MYEIYVPNKGRFYVASRVVALSCCQETWHNCQIVLKDALMQNFDIVVEGQVIANVMILPTIQKPRKLFDIPEELPL